SAARSEAEWCAVDPGPLRTPALEWSRISGASFRATRSCCTASGTRVERACVMAQTESSFDVIVIGGGIAGMVAANRAAQFGKRVAVLEKSTEEKYICNSRITYGTFHINFASPVANEDDLVRRIETCTEGYARKDLARTVA